MIKQSIYFLLGLGGIAIVSYFFQPVKKGNGLDTSTKYEPVKNWPDLPWDFKLGNPTGISVDTNQNIVVFHRAERKWPLIGSMPSYPISGNTIVIIDRNDGRLIRQWGNNLFIMPHGLTVDSANNIWVTDVALHQIFKFSPDGNLLMRIGEEKIAGNDSLHFNQPTDIAIAKDGSFYVSDGYGNSRIVKFSATGKYLFEWGKKGNHQGEFNIPHGITLDAHGNVYVADRENNRIQMFDPNGRFKLQFTDNSFGAICGITFNETQSKLFAVDDLSYLKLKHRGSDLLIFDTTGRVQTRFGRSGSYHGHISWYHDVAVDDNGNIYIVDILRNTIQKFKKTSDH